MISETEASPSWRVGVHTSIAGSLDQAADKAHQLGCTAFQIFSTNPRMWKSREPTREEISGMARRRRQHDLFPLAIHVNYLVNLASPDASIHQKSVEAFRGEVQRAVALRAEYLVLHPGSFRDSSAEQGMRSLTSSIRQVLRDTPLDGVTLLIENTCGQGNVLGCDFRQLRDILALLDGIPSGCCIDTAHCFAAGMDVSSPSGLERMLDSLRQTIGVARVPMLHCNDSRSGLGSRWDRHEHIGHGGIGREGFRRIVNHPKLREKIFILETPLEKPGDDRRNLRAIKALRANANGGGRIRAGSVSDRTQNTRRLRKNGSAPSRSRL